MKKTILIIVAILMALPTIAQEKKGKPEITFERRTINFGTFPAENSVKVAHFVFTNTGDADLYIHQSFVSCGCTATRIPENAIKPGETDTITVTYDGRRKSPGKMRRSITIHNNSQEEMIKLYVIGKMLPHKEQEVEEVKIEE
ncbi:MAG: DUF1573 domain-containing protein [Bacteroidaceae bacterium]|nr:DUF1573 domain-containing protein [Bacteroidaceae bacterium]